ncbi:RNA polymerase sigma-70 factor [Taibaiella lutea]|uniref:RNA polymerase sigma-70 factor n=1 Tax=Taibaiella lutea TaxID=2608001 RepID=A0A5M6CUM9_9BACT|nr:RNA polymerase sigma-70 factor [Taibaiella lutea]KAA5536889.1 RNA polymerase sigma-70 factor [Taibaiella lutea]
MSLPEIEQLFKEHYEALYRYAFSILKNEEDAKDVLQIVFINLWERRETLHINSSSKAYLYRSVYNESLNYIKKESVRQKHETGAFSLQENPGQEDANEAGIWEQKINKVLEQMPPQCKAVFLKSRIENKKYAEIAAELDISVKTVEAHMSKALKIIRATIGVLWLLSCLPLESLN